MRIGNHTTPNGIAITPQGREIAYNFYGRPLAANNGACPVIVMHGTPGSRVGPMPRSSYLNIAGISLIAPDRSGYGLSSPNPGRSVSDVADDIKTLAHSLDIPRFGVLGRSGGGPGALACAAKLGDQVMGVAILSCMPPNNNPTEETAEINQTAFGDDAEKAEQAIISLAAEVQQDPRALLRAIRPGLAASDHYIVDSYPIRQELLSSYSEAVRENGAAGWVEDILALRKPWGFSLSDIPPTCPVGIWQPADDNFINRSEYLALEPYSEIPNVSIHVSPDGHFSAFEATVHALGCLARQKPFGWDNTWFI